MSAPISLDSLEAMKWRELAEKQGKAIAEMVEAYGEMEKGIEDPILCHYNGIRLHNAMENLRVLVLPGYTAKYEPSEVAE